MGRYKYSKPENEINKILKIDAIESEITDNQNKRTKKILDEHIGKSEELLKVMGKDPQKTKEEKPKMQLPQKKTTMTLRTWEEIVDEANSLIPYDVELENILTTEEFKTAYTDLERIKSEFASKVKMNRLDLKFLMVATALQTLKWLVLPALGEKIDLSSRTDDKAGEALSKKKKIKFAEMYNDWPTSKESQGRRGRESEGKSWREIIFSGVPYDVTAGSPNLGINMEGRYHRYKTLGHDPILGWVFGTANILTDTITLNNLMSYRVYKGKFTNEMILLPQVFGESYYWINDDYHRLPAALFRQALHYETDKYTKLGLPVPILGAFSEELAGKLYKSQYDALCFERDTNIVSSSAAISIIINMIIGLMHGLFYKEEVDGDREFYEVRTRKVLAYSNAIASSSNIITVLIAEKPDKLDIGGLLVTITRLFTDIRFITKLKDEFINVQLDEGMQRQLDETDRLYNEMLNDGLKV